MKATGIVRRIDDLGRIVIPKEIRRTLRLREGDPLELYTDGGAVIFKKYVPTSETDVSNIIKGMVASIGAIDKNLRAAAYNTDGVRIKATHTTIFAPSLSDTPDKAEEIEECFNVLPITDGCDTMAYLVIDDDHNKELVNAIIRTTQYILSNSNG